MDQFWLALLKTEKGIFILLDDNNNIVGFKSESEGINYFTKGYNNAHARSYEGSMSACIAFIQVQPSIIKATLDDVKTWIGGADKAHLYQLSSMAFFGKGLKLTTEFESKWDEGAKPALISENDLEATYQRREEKGYRS